MRSCPTCHREVGTFATGALRPHHRPHSTTWCTGGGVQISRTEVRRLVREYGVVEAARRLTTSPSTLRRLYGHEDWWPGHNRLWRYRHRLHPGVTTDPDCPGCTQRRADQSARRRARYLASDTGRAIVARRAARAAMREKAEQYRRETEDDRCYVAEMVSSGKAKNMRRALRITTTAVEQHLGIGHTALSKIENGRRPPMTRVFVHARRYAALLRTWEQECKQRGIDPSSPQPTINRRRGVTRH
jgi:hypothetical protein